MITRSSRGWRVAALAVTLMLAAGLPASADEGHDPGTTTVGLDPATLLWGITSLGGIFLALFFSRWLLRRGGDRPSTGSDQVGYLAAIGRFSRNARLFLTYSLMAQLGTGIWAVLFNLYLLREGFGVTFIGMFWLVNMLCHGTAALPAGVIADRFGRRRAFFIATGVSIVAQGSLLFTAEPIGILVLAGVAGFGEAFHGVTGAPFMMENSEPAERPHLFGLNSALLQVSRFAGNLSGGLLPLVWAGVIGVPAIEASAARWALVAGLPLTAVALVPLAFMREKPVELPGSLRELVTLRNVVHRAVIARLTLLGVFTGVAFGLTIRFFNVFFEEVHSAADSEIGTILGLGAIASAGAVLLAPVLAQRFGKVVGIVISQAASTPFLLLMAIVPSLSLVITIFLARSAFAAIAQPLQNQLAMEFVSSRERGTTAGFTHTAFDLGGGIGAGVASVVILGGGFLYTFGVAAILVLIPACLYYVWFKPMEATRRPVPVAQPVAAGAEAK